MAFKESAVVSMMSYAASKKEKNTPVSGPRPEPPVPAGCVHIRSYVRTVWRDSGRVVSIRTATSSASNAYAKKNGNLNFTVKDAVTLFIPLGKNSRDGLRDIASAYEGAAYSGDGLTVHIPKGTVMVAYSDFSQENAWDTVLRSIATFFVDDGVFQLTIKSNGKTYSRTTRRSFIAPNGDRVVMGT